MTRELRISIPGSNPSRDEPLTEKGQGLGVTVIIKNKYVIDRNNQKQKSLQWELSVGGI